MYWNSCINLLNSLFISKQYQGKKSNNKFFIISLILKIISNVSSSAWTTARKILQSKINTQHEANFVKETSENCVFKINPICCFLISPWFPLTWHSSFCVILQSWIAIQAYPSKWFLYLFFYMRFPFFCVSCFSLRIECFFVNEWEWNCWREELENWYKKTNFRDFINRFRNIWRILTNHDNKFNCQSR